MTRAEAETVWRDLAAAAMLPDAKPETARLAVVVALTRATGARYGDLLRCTVDSLALHPESARPEQGSVVVLHGKHRTPRDHRLDGGEVVLLRHWLAVRAELCAGLEGNPPRALLLTVHHTHDNGTTVSRGLPITKQGLVLSWRRYVQRTNARWAGVRPPLPTRFEQVRRAWSVEPGPDDASVRAAEPAGRGLEHGSDRGQGSTSSDAPRGPANPPGPA
ncbi:hypothetical protein GCM10025865_29130 [Paraoerskovia sediminicola]|uniref:Phage integrase family protein n=1 Tax=Paraoerskovia sediminicola TaxID=1138587 RepID=A0ABN6XFQ4_9CELL|nr:hypothetical protein GCM10025865_29130 [Paraoerskovia sediminicola]